MKSLRLLCILLVATSRLYAQATPEKSQSIDPTLPKTIKNAQKSLFQALKNESVNDYLMLFPSKEEFLVVFPKKEFIHDFLKGNKDADPDKFKKIVETGLANGELYNDVFLSTAKENFVYFMKRGKEIGINWPEITWTSCAVDSMQDTYRKRYTGSISFSCKGKAYIIKEKYFNYKNTFLIEEVLTPYIDPFDTFQNRVTTFLSDQVKGNHYTYSNALYKKEKSDSILLKNSPEFFKEKTLKNTKTQQEFFFLFLKYKSASECMAACDKLYKSLGYKDGHREATQIAIEIKQSKSNQTMYLMHKNELIVFKTPCANKDENWLELRNELVSEFNPSEILENYCVNSDHEVSPPPPPFPSKK